MSKVSPYPHWHFIDSNAPGHFLAVYRGNGIPLLWGSMTMATDPCPHWAVFRMGNGGQRQSNSQSLVIRENDGWKLYCVPHAANPEYGREIARIIGRDRLAACINFEWL